MRILEACSSNHRALAEQTLKGNERLPVTMTLSVGKIDLKLSFDGELNLE